MISIKSDQLEQLGQPTYDSFKSKLVIHVHKHFPKECKTMTEAGTLETVQYGLQKARAYGFTKERSVTKFINLMFVFGRDFDSSEEHLWSSETLHLNEGELPERRIDTLYEIGIQQEIQQKGFSI